jgi:hypothetical protein
MAFRQNYGLQRAERNRLKQAKKEAKVQELRDTVLRRRTEQNGAGPTDAEATEPDASISNSDPKNLEVS